MVGSKEILTPSFAGLVALPTPVPVDEYAAAHGLDVEAIESFAADLHPLLERTNQGLTLRDEPTETLLHARYGSSMTALSRLATNLLGMQDRSAYAARALPGLLYQMRDATALFALALDERIPSTITSTVGIRNVRYARLRAATIQAADDRKYNYLVRHAARNVERRDG